MAAFFAAYLASGWRPGEAFAEGDALLAASGATFAAIVVGQMANAFACRSATRWVGQMSWRTNPLLVWAVLVELGALAGFLFVAPVADLLDQAPPPAWAWPVVLAAAPVLLAADTIQKLVAHRR
jgi:hypothetical protein